MKQVFLFLVQFILIISVFSGASAQSLARQTISSTGNYSFMQGMLLRQTIGQSYDTKTSYGTGISYSPGFQQKEVTTIEVVKKTLNVRVFPNPTSDFVDIQSSTAVNDVTLRFVDQLGRILHIETIEQFKQYTLDCSVFPDGQYYVTLTSPDTKSFVAKIIILQ